MDRIRPEQLNPPQERANNNDFLRIRTYQDAAIQRHEQAKNFLARQLGCARSTIDDFETYTRVLGVGATLMKVYHSGLSDLQSAESSLERAKAVIKMTPLLLAILYKGRFIFRGASMERVAPPEGEAEVNENPAQFIEALRAVEGAEVKEDHKQFIRMLRERLELPQDDAELNENRAQFIESMKISADKLDIEIPDT